MTTPSTLSSRLDGLDLARLAAFIGMVIVNFAIVMGAEGGEGPAAGLIMALEGRAAATFVVLAGVGLGLASHTDGAATLKRAAVLMALGLANMTVFEADILHYYAAYFVFGVLLMPCSDRVLWAVIAGLNGAFVALLVLLEYDTGWNWETLAYTDFWTAPGFIRNLFFNGWHPVIPWLSFLVLGLLLSRMALSDGQRQTGLIVAGAAALALAELLAALVAPLAAAVDPELAALATTAPVPPTPFYILAGSGAAVLVIGLCLKAAPWLERAKVLQAVLPAGRQTLTLYIAHILIGMGILEALGLIGGPATALEAVTAAVLFCAAALVYAALWHRLAKRGPVESLLRLLTTRRRRPAGSGLS